MSRADSVGIAGQHDIEQGAPAVVSSPPVTSAELELNREEMEIDETYGTRAPTRQDYGGKIFDGPLEGAWRPRSGGIILNTFWGPPVTTQPDPEDAPGVFEHLWNPLLQDPMFLSIWTKVKLPRGQGFLTDKYEGALGNELSLSVAANEYLTHESNLLARRIVPEPTPAPSFTRDSSGRFSFKQVKVYMSIDGGAEDEIKVKEWGASYNNNLVDDEFILGSDLVDDIPFEDIEGEVTFRPTRDLAAHNRRALADYPELVQLRMVALGPVIATVGGTDYRQTFEVKAFGLETVTAPVPIDGSETLRDIEVTCRLVLNEDVNKLITARVVNDYDGANYQLPEAA